jgi:hypothetical protein
VESLESLGLLHWGRDVQAKIGLPHFSKSPTEDWKSSHGCRYGLLVRVCELSALRNAMKQIPHMGK